MSVPRNFNQVEDTMLGMDGTNGILVVPTLFSSPDIAALPRTTSGPIRQAMVTIESVEGRTAGPAIGESSIANYIPPEPRRAYTDLRLAMGGNFSTDFQRLQEVLHRAAGRR